ncbi:aminotransferase class I/II-fold pyridoxal phosphate-dependent enzyme [Pontibacter sp. BT310]|uniref:Aminotransferase class I/II-fold pyridoxal phosphate-dependent enzyme n=1 Tax=Pontibacter populi TaxID=890055 RepID=A0ABS6XDM6_9BACT|nr:MULTISPECIES: aminotransferase class I/II-fold pyridoxal phosphate-dependent enzyme [Pontibacter]MBJ6119210.1 aminotransferase class I/II-fold pyridoxal phosphate-dependent enzyme [Pontibacter sp. BT310]MBR0571638.1 aminotransferase class I/II-fold pyridoxal phosphate-dependent enzyme [Microvirga sp. STS03]MBW3366064.1 aminotransferase class I/II-fold pyridoxal phosphate-dependent enzyme [Pontibacter populi]
MNNKIWLSSPHMGGTEEKYVKEAFDTNWVAPLGPNVDGFEKDLESFLGNDVHVAALSSGTAALHLALIILGVKASDEVICQSMTFSASANPIAYQGATPVFVDSEERTWNMSPEYLEAAIQDRIRKGKKPKAIIVVHLYGMPAEMDTIMEVADKYEIPVVEDAAEALGSSYKGRPLGTFGAMSILSFNGNKIITTSGGGALVSPNEEWIKKARFLATQARDNAPHYQHSHIGYNYRMSNICAGIGRGQMEVLQERVQQRRNNFESYKAVFGANEAISFHEEVSADFYSNRWLSTVLVNEDSGISREDIRLALEKQNIESRPLWKPMHLQPVFEDAPFYGDGASERLFKDGLCLPSGSNLLQTEIERVIKIINTCFSNVSQTT